MTTPAHAIQIGAHLPSQDMVQSAGRLCDIIHARMNDEKVVHLKISNDGKMEDLVLEPELTQLLIQILAHLQNGEGVTFVPISKRMTTQQAADILNVSRPYFIKLLQNGEIPFETIGRHRRVLAKDLFSYKRKRDEARNSALDALFEDDGELY